MGKFSSSWPVEGMNDSVAKICEVLWDCRVCDDSVTYLSTGWKMFKKSVNENEYYLEVSGFDSLLWCSTKLIFQEEYCTVDLKLKHGLGQAIKDCKDLSRLSRPQSQLCIKLAEICVDPWSCQLFTSVTSAEGKYENGAALAASALWNLEGSVVTYRRVEALVTRKNCQKELQHLLQSLVLYFSDAVSDRFAELMAENTREFLKMEMSDIFAVYGISCYLNKISMEVFLSLHDESLCLILLSLSRSMFDSESLSEVRKIFTKGEITQAYIYFVRTVFWKMLSRESNSYTFISHVYNIWMHDYQNQPDLILSDYYIPSPIKEIEDNIVRLQFPRNFFNCAKLLQPKMGTTKTPSLFLSLLIRGIHKESKTILLKTTSQKSNNSFDRNKSQLLAEKFIELAYYCSNSHYLKKRCMLAAFSLHPCGDVYLAMFLENHVKRQASLSHWPILREIGISQFDTLKDLNKMNQPDEVMMLVEEAILSCLHSELIGVESEEAAHDICVKLLLNKHQH